MRNNSIPTLLSSSFQKINPSESKVQPKTFSFEAEYSDIIKCEEDDVELQCLLLENLAYLKQAIENLKDLDQKITKLEIKLRGLEKAHRSIRYQALNYLGRAK